MNKTISTDSLAQFVDLWIADLREKDRAANTIRLYKKGVLSFIQWYQAQEHRLITLDDLTPIALIGYRNEIQHHQNKASSTINAHVAAIRAWCGWLHQKKYIPNNPAAHVKFVDQTASSRTGLKDKEINALLRQAQRTRYPERDYAILQVLLQTGMRIGECAALNYQDVAIGERSGSVTIRGGKGNKARMIPLNGSARKALIDYVALIFHQEARLETVLAVWPARQVTQPVPLWLSQKAGRMSTSAIQRMIDKLVQTCFARGLVPKETSAHVLRHTFASNYLQENMGDVMGLATLLGHDSLDTTRIYSQPTLDQLADRVDHLKQNAYAE